MKKFLLLLFAIGYLFSAAGTAQAESDYFSRKYDVTYTVKEDGKTTVVLTVTLTNKTSEYYASNDTITVGFDDIQDVKARDSSTELKAVVTRTKEGNAIEIPFNQKVVGKDKALTFVVTFETTNVAHHKGKTWEINIPGISSPDDFSDFKAEVKVPESFGKPSYIKPVQKDNVLIFTKEELGKSGISIAYGDEQVYELDLTYHLRNKNIFPIRTEIALPMNTNYQEVAIDSIEPKPTNVITDIDGNWLAQYTLSPSEKIDIKVKGAVKVRLIPIPVEISDDEKKLYTKDQKYWQVSSAKLEELAKIYDTPQKIYNYTVSTLTYDFDRVTQNKPRLGAVEAISDPASAVCLEFTDLFIALARAAGIPAREVNGFADTENSKQRPLSLVQDILHAWPEYYDFTKGTWVMVDPTWGNTTGGTDYFSVLDLDHIAFIRKGKTSEYPVPAGGYKFEGDEDKKDVNVSFNTSFPTGSSKAVITSDFPSELLSFLPLNGSIRITNSSPILFPSQVAVISSNDLKPSKQQVILGEIPPFGFKDVPVRFDQTSFFTNKRFSFTFKLQDTIIQKSVLITPFALSKMEILALGGIILALSTIIIFIFTRKARRIHLPEQGRADSLRGEGQKPQV